MRRLLTVVKDRLARKANCTARPAIESLEQRTFLSAAPTAIVNPPPVSGTILQNPFLNASSLIEGEVFIDANNNGQLDISDTGAAFAIVFVDLNNNGIADATDEIAQAGSDGTFFLEVPPGTYNVRVEPMSPYVLESNSPGLLPITISANSQFLGANFGFAVPASVSGTVFGDTNGNGIQDAGETGVAGRTVYADENNDGILDAGEPFAITDASGNYTLTGLGDGTFTIRMQAPLGAKVTAPAAGFYHVASVAGQTVTGQNFGVTGPDLAIQMLTAPPTLVIGGQKQKPIVVSITNVGSQSIDNLVGVSLYASTDNVVDASDTPVGGLLGRMTKLKPGQSKTLRLPFLVPPALASGSYKILAQVISSVPDENSSNDVASAGVSTQIMKPFTDLAIGYAAQPALVMDYATAASVSVVLTNHGNVEFDGMVKIGVYESTDGSVQDSTDIVHSKDIHIKLLPQQNRVLTIPIAFTGTVKGEYFLISTVDPISPVSDIDDLNNQVVSLLPSIIH